MEQQGMMPMSRIENAEAYADNQDYKNMVAFLDKKGDPEQIKAIIDPAIEKYPQWFSDDFKNNIGVWEEEISGQKDLSPQATDFLKKIIAEFWKSVYKDGAPRIQIYFEEDIKPLWPEDAERR